MLTRGSSCQHLLAGVSGSVGTLSTPRNRNEGRRLWLWNRAVDALCPATWFRDHRNRHPPEMIAKARELDPDGDYRLIKGGDFSGLSSHASDLVLCMFPFDNIAGFEVKLGQARQRSVITLKSICTSGPR